jgi:hypothetical protein
MFGNRMIYKLGAVVLGVLGLMSVLGEVVFWAVRFWTVLVPLAVVFLLLIWHGMAPEPDDHPNPSLFDRLESAAMKVVSGIVLVGAAMLALGVGGYMLVLRSGFWLVSTPVIIAFLALLWLTLRPRRS